jgi:hypothetical protein
MPTLLGDSRDPINAQVAHLSMRRESRPLWDMLALTDSVLDQVAGPLVGLEGGEFAECFGAAAEIVEDYQLWSASVVEGILALRYSRNAAPMVDNMFGVVAGSFSHPLWAINESRVL